MISNFGLKLKNQHFAAAWKSRYPWAPSDKEDKLQIKTLPTTSQGHLISFIGGTKMIYKKLQKQVNISLFLNEKINFEGTQLKE